MLESVHACGEMMNDLTDKRELENWIKTIPSNELLDPNSVYEFIDKNPGVRCRRDTIATSVSSILYSDVELANTDIPACV